MFVEPLEDAASPFLPGRRRKSCRITYELAGAEPETVWFDVPEDVADGVDARGNAWLICFLPLAVTLREKLVIRGAVDPLLLQNAGELMRIWAKWHPGLDVVEVEAPLQTRRLNQASSRVGCFFSGGVDSFFTVLHQGSEVLRYEQAGERAIDDLVLVWGFDLPLDRKDEFTKLRASLSTAAEELGKRFFVVATNLREGQYRRLAWGRLSHGCALGAVAHLLSGAFSTFFISSSFAYHEWFAWGSHPLTDPLMSSADLMIRHYGCGFDRVEKTEFVSRHAVALQRVHVCYRARTAANCGTCSKCSLTMLALEILGRLPETSAFPTGLLNLARTRRLMVADDGTASHHRLIVRHAQARNRMDVVAALQACARWNRRRRFIQALAGRYERIPLINRLLAALDRRLHRGAIV